MNVDSDKPAERELYGVRTGAVVQEHGPPSFAVYCTSYC